MYRLFHKTFVSNVVTIGVVLFALVIIFSECKGKKILTVEQIKYDFGNAFNSDTLKIMTNKADVAWSVTTDQYWVVVDSQVQFGTKDFLFSVLENTDTVARQAKLFITGQDLDTVFIEVTQSKGHPIVFKPSAPQQYTTTDGEVKQKRKKKIIVEEMEEFPSNELSKPTTETTTSKDSTATGTVEATPKPVANKMEISTDAVTLGAAGNLESSTITIDATGNWVIKTPPPSWLDISGIDGKAISKGSGSTNFKIKTRSANTTTNPRETVLEFQLGKLIKTIKVTQKPTEADLTVDKQSIKFYGEPDDAPTRITVNAVNTQWEIRDEIPDWLTVSKLKGGAGESVINVQTTINETNQVRNFKFNIVSTGGVIKKEISITQDVQSVKVAITQPEALGSKADALVTFTINSNVEWEIKKKEGVATWYNLDIMNGPGGEDNVETITVTATEDNNDEMRSDTLLFIAQNVKRKIVISQKGNKLKVVTIALSSDSINWDKDLSDNVSYQLNVNTNDDLQILNLPTWLDAYDVQTKQKVSTISGNAKIEFKLNKSKDSIKINKNHVISFISKADPNTKKTITIKLPGMVVKKEVNVSGLNFGNFIPYVELGNVTKQTGENTKSIPTTKTMAVYSSVDFAIQQEAAGASITAEEFFTIKVDNVAYVLGDIIPSGNHEVSITAKGDNVSENPKSKIKILYFTTDGDTQPFNDKTNDKKDVLQFEVKQEPYILDSRQPKIFLKKLEFNGYNSLVLLGNPEVKKGKNDTTKSTPSKKIIYFKTDKPIKINMVEDKNPFFNILIGSNEGKINTAYKFGKPIPAGEYYVQFEAKKNYTDPNGFNSRQTLTLYFEIGEEKKKAKKGEEGDIDAQVQPNLTFIDNDNKDFTGSQFRTEFLIEQESL